MHGVLYLITEELIMGESELVADRLGVMRVSKILLVVVVVVVGTYTGRIGGKGRNMVVLCWVQWFYGNTTVLVTTTPVTCTCRNIFFSTK